jgi:hypothetical protein
MTEALRKKYPKWAHRKEERKRRRKKSRRRRRRRKRKGDTNTTEVMLVSLLQQLLMGPTTLAKKHGENVQTGYMNMVTPDALAPVRSRAWMREMMREDEPAGGAGAGAGAVAGVVGRPPARLGGGRSRPASPHP